MRRSETKLWILSIVTVAILGWLVVPCTAAESNETSSGGTANVLLAETSVDPVDSEESANEESAVNEEADAVDDETADEESETAQSDTEQEDSDEAPDDTASSEETEFPGTELLAQAMQKRLTMRTQLDMDEVIGMIGSALAAGIPESDQVFTKEMLAYLLFQRAVIRIQPILSQIDPEAELDHSLFSENADLKKALVDLEEAVKLNPSLIEAWIRIATLRQVQGGDENKQLALDAVNQAVEHSRDEPMKCIEALRLRCVMRQTPEEKIADLDEALTMIPEHIQTLKMRAIVRMEIKDYEKSFEDLNHVIQLDPTDAATIQVRAHLLVLMGRPAEAIASLDAAMESGEIENTQSLQFEKATLLAQQKEYPAALEELKKILAENPSVLEAWLLRATICRQMGNYDESLSDIDRLMMIAPRSLELIRMKIFVLLDADRCDEAVAYAEKTLGNRRREPDVRLLFASIKMEMEDYELALKELNELLRMSPNEPNVLLMRGNAYSGLGQQAKAKVDYEKALEGAPDEPLIQNNYAWLLATAPQDELRDGAKAVELALKACETTEYKEAYILSTLAAAYAETGDFDKAIEFSTKAAQANDEDDRTETYENEIQTYQEKRPFREERMPSRRQRDAQSTDDENNDVTESDDAAQIENGNAGNVESDADTEEIDDIMEPDEKDATESDDAKETEDADPDEPTDSNDDDNVTEPESPEIEDILEI